MACLTFTSNVKCEGRGQRACLSLRLSIAISAGLGGVLPILALVISNRVARRSAQPFVQFDDAIGKMQNVGFEKVALPDMQRSPIAELATSADRLMTTARARARQSMCSAFSCTVVDAPARRRRYRVRKRRDRDVSISKASAVLRRNEVLLKRRCGSNPPLRRMRAGCLANTLLQETTACQALGAVLLRRLDKGQLMSNRRACIVL
jgi:hypothetical protein